MSFDQLSLDSILQICDYLDIWDLQHLICANKKFKTIGIQGLKRRDLLDQFVLELRQSGIYSFKGKFGRECNLIGQFCELVSADYHSKVKDKLIKQVLIRIKFDSNKHDI